MGSEARDCESGGNNSWLIIGLGNPGGGYRDTYHNVGFRVVGLLADRIVGLLADRRGVADAYGLGSALILGTRAGGVRAALVQPQTYMNRSGEVLPALFERFGFDSRVLVVSDDLALPLGRIRVRERGSSGGHNGLKSIGSALGSDDYMRVRVGISPDRSVDGTRDFVLSPVARTDRSVLGSAEELAADAVEHVLSDGARSAMSRFNGMDLSDGGDS
jgi:PTH1 family peptidyl-tRNA hydrolase